MSREQRFDLLTQASVAIASLFEQAMPVASVALDRRSQDVGDALPALGRHLAMLPARQRQALVLRYWLDLREAEVAAAMGISKGAVKAHTSRGMAALTRRLGEAR